MSKIIYRHGDLWLELPEMKFLVSSSVLAVSSDYFYMLLNAGFSESQQSFNDPANPAHIKMEEDDHASMAILLKLLHHQYQILDTNHFSVSALPGLCVLADKYQWMQHLQPLLRLFLTFCLPNDMYSRNVASALAISSYMLQEGTIFRKATAWLVQKELGIVLRDYPGTGDYLHPNMYSMMPKQMNAISEEAVKQPAYSVAADCGNMENFFLPLQGISLVQTTMRTRARKMANMITSWMPAYQSERDLKDSLFALALEVFIEYAQWKQVVQYIGLARVDHDEIEECDKLVAKWTSPSNILPPIALKAAFDAEVRRERTRQPAGLCLHCLRGGDERAWLCHRQPSPHS